MNRMSKSSITNNDEVLDEWTLQLLSDAPAVVNAAPKRMRNLRERIMQQVDDDIANATQSFLIVRHNDGAWIEIAPKVKKKVLYQDPDTGTESYLLRAEPGGEAPPHIHEHDEHCVVLEGELSFDDGVHMEAGDYLFAPAGSEHGIARTDAGVLVFIQASRPRCSFIES